jgi:putative Holliday junction resolvase
MRVMAIDYGDARTGVAVSDALGMLVGFTTVVSEWNREQAAEKVAALVREHRPERLVMGFPKNMDGTEGPRADLYREFAALLQEKTGMEVILWDERRTTVEAHNILRANGKKTKKHKKNVDAVAASLILEGYLSFLG